VYAAYEHATGNVLFLPKDKEIISFFRKGTSIRIIQGLWGGAFMGRALATTIPVTFYLFLERKKIDLFKILLVGMLVIQFYSIVIAMTRTPWYALLLGMFIMQFFYPQFRKLFFVLVFAATVVLWITWDQVNQSEAAQRVNDKVSTLEGREARWQAGVKMWKVKPIWGWGFGWYAKKSGSFRTDGEYTNFENGAVENDYLHILIGSGLVGLLPYLIFLFVPLVNSLRLFFRARAPDWPGFIKPETLTIYWALILTLVMGGYTGIYTPSSVGIKMIVFAVAGAVVGAHEPLLRGIRADTRLRSSVNQVMIKPADFSASS
jgi:O-antigen ligase